MPLQPCRRKFLLASRCGLALMASIGGISTAAIGQQAPADLTALPPTPTDYTPGKTPWGDWDFTGTWPFDYEPQAHILFQRPPGYGNRLWLTPEEHAKRAENATKTDASYSAEDAGIQAQAGTQGMADWVRSSGFSWRTSLLVSPANGQLPPLTPKGEELFMAGRSGWIPNQPFDWVDDFDTWDRCVTRGFPASMFPNRYNNALRIFQSPGYIVIVLEMLGRRVIPIVPKAEVDRHWPRPVEAWMGNSRAYWDGKTLVIDTVDIKSGDSVSHDMSKRAAAPVIVTMVGGAARDTIPTSDKAHTVEKLTMTGPNAILYQITYDDPETFTAPWTAQIEWTRDDSYVMPEYACHEGDVQVRNYISSSRAKRAAIAAGKLAPNHPDGSERNLKPYEVDPVAQKAAGADAPGDNKDAGAK